MGFTILPDMQAKKEQRRKRKERKEKRRAGIAKKRRKRYLKRKSFASVLLSTLLITAMILGTIGGGILYYRVNAAVQESINELDERVDIIRSNMQNSYTKWQEKTDLSAAEREEQFQNFMYLYILMIPDMFPFSEGAGAIYDTDGNVLASTGEPMGLLQEHYDEESSQGTSYPLVWRKLYAAGNQPDETIMKEYGEYYQKMCMGEEYEVKVSSGYLDGDVFYYGKIEFYAPGETGVKKLVKTYDCSPADTSGMQEIHPYEQVDRTGEHDYYIPILHRNSEVETEAEANLIYQEHKSDERLSGASSIGEKGFGRYVRSTFDRIQVVDDKEYILVTAVQYDFMDQNGAWVWKYCLAFLVAILLFGFMIAKYRYVRLKAHYDFEDYQKNLTNAMAHDLKSPLMVLSGMAENLKEQVHTEKRDYYAEEIIRLVGDMNHMVEQILGFSKLGNVNTLGKKESVDVRRLTEEIVQGYEQLCSDGHIHIDVDGDLMLEGDAVLLRQMMDNLIRNALVHGDAGVIAIELSEKSITIENNYSGPLAQKDVPRLLEAFEKEDSRKQTGGHGLGLSIVKQIVELHGGRLSVTIADKRFSVRVEF